MKTLKQNIDNSGFITVCTNIPLAHEANRNFCSYIFGEVVIAYGGVVVAHY
jgi:hypothetical protein